MTRITTGFILFLILFLISGQNSVVNAQQVTISPQPLYFGITPDGRDTFRDIVVRNTSASALSISQISIEGTNAGEFSIVDNPGSLNISAFSRSELTIKFNPQSTGDKTAQIVFTSNAPSSPDKVDLLSAASNSSAVITFEKILGTLERDGASDLKPTLDGGFIICGSTYNKNEDFNDGYLVKTNAYGEVEWTQAYDSDAGDDNSDGFSSVVQVSDGYITVGSAQSGPRNDLWIVKTDLSGVLQWEKLLGGTDDDGAAMIEPTTDGNFIIVGYTVEPTGVNGKNGYLIKIDGQGTVLWSQSIGGSDGESFSSVRQTGDGGYIIGGTISTGGTGSDMYLVKTNDTGQVTWDEQYGETGEAYVDIASSVIIAPGGGYILVGKTTSSFSTGANDVYVIKTSDTGVQDMTWGNKTFGQEHHDGASEVIATSDGGYLVVGSIENHYEPLPINDWFSDVCVIKLDQSGNFQWDKVYGGLRNEGASSVHELSDGTFVISGSTSSYGSSTSDSDIYFLRLNAEGNITAIEDISIVIPAEMHLAQNYPNPFNNSTVIEYHLPVNTHIKLDVYNMIGQKVRTVVDAFKKQGAHTVYFDSKGLASGLYFYRLKMGNFADTKRMLLLK